MNEQRSNLIRINYVRFLSAMIGLLGLFLPWFKIQVLFYPVSINTFHFLDLKQMNHLNHFLDSDFGLFNYFIENIKDKIDYQFIADVAMKAQIATVLAYVSIFFVLLSVFPKIGRYIHIVTFLASIYLCIYSIYGYMIIQSLVEELSKRGVYDLLQYQYGIFIAIAGSFFILMSNFSKNS